MVELPVDGVLDAADELLDLLVLLPGVVAAGVVGVVDILVVAPGVVDPVVVPVVVPAGADGAAVEFKQLRSVPVWTVNGADCEISPVLSRRVMSRLVPTVTFTFGQRNDVPV